MAKMKWGDKKHLKFLNEFTPIISDDEYKIVAMMEKYGGSFVKALAVAFYRADHGNFKKLKNAFPDYWKEYQDFAKKE